MIEARTDSISTISFYHKVDPQKLYRNYKDHTSNFHEWEQKTHAEEYLLYPKNIGERLSIDEVALTQDELYTIITNKERKAKKGSLVAIIKDTNSSKVNSILEKINLSERNKVKEITLDMAKNMEAIVKISFPRAQLVTDHFHVVRLVLDALQHLRIKYRWQAIDKENEEIKQTKLSKTKYIPEIFPNGDTLKQLLARSKYLLYKHPSNWTKSQLIRASILFEKYPLLKKAYELTNQFRAIFNNKNSNNAKEQFLQWFEEIDKLQIDQFNTAVNSIKYHFEHILNFFNNRSTNANAESFNAKLKGFRAVLKGVRNNLFFLFRLEKLFA